MSKRIRETEEDIREYESFKEEQNGLLNEYIGKYCSAEGFS